MQQKAARGQGVARAAGRRGGGQGLVLVGAVSPLQNENFVVIGCATMGVLSDIEPAGSSNIHFKGGNIYFEVLGFVFSFLVAIKIKNIFQGWLMN